MARDVYEAARATLSADVEDDEGESRSGEDERERARRACATFVAMGLLDAENERRGDVRRENTSDTDITAILRAHEISLVEFLDALPEFLNASARSLAVRVTSGSSTVAEIERVLRVREIRSAFAFNKVIATKFHDFMVVHFDAEHDLGRAFARLGWSLYLCAKCESLPAFPDLYSCFHLLIAVEAFLLTNAPKKLLRTTLKNMVNMTVKDEATQLPDPLRSLSAGSKTKLDIVLRMGDAVVKAALASFPGATQDRTKHRDDVAPSDLCVQGAFEFDFEFNRMNSAEFIIASRYTELAKKTFGRLAVDERMYMHVENDDEDSDGRQLIGDLSQSKTATMLGSMATPARRHRAAPFSPFRPKKIEMVGAGPASPLHGFAFRSAQQIPLSTPITQAITSATWLHDDVCSSGIDKKLETLQTFVPGDADVVKKLHKTVVELGQRIGQAIREDALVTTMRTDISPQSTVMDDLVAQRTSEIVNVFFYFLNRILKDEVESARGKTADMNFATLLQSKRFTKSLLTCAMEVIVSTYKTSTLTFPATPHLLGIHPFDLVTIIEPFVRADMNMPREIQRHFNSLEEKTLERMAWGKGSTLFEFLQTFHEIVNDNQSGGEDCKTEIPSTSGVESPEDKPRMKKSLSKLVLSVGSIAELAAMGGADTGRKHTQDEDERLPMAQCQSPVRRAPTSAFTAFSSPMRGVTTPGRRSSVNGTLPDRFAAVLNHDVTMPSGCDVCAFKALRMFFAKVMHLAARRLSDLCSRLNLTQDILRDVYALVEHVVYEKTSLLYNRHLDQVILAAVYGVCKVNSGGAKGPVVAFRDIINQYSKQPQSNEEVFWTVVLEQTDPELEVTRRGDVISFYNDVFVLGVKSFLLALREKSKTENTTSKSTDTDSEPLPPGLSSPTPRVPNSPNHNIYVSPMRSDRINAMQMSAPPHTPRSKSLFATIGESAHAFQSPSRVFDSINRASRSPSARADGPPRRKIPKFGDS